jgi:23S rRNA pseudouridine2605 synthase
LEERLHKVIAQAGVCSRRRAEGLIRAGRVKVNGIVVTQLGQKVNLTTDFITVDGTTITVDKERAYIMLHKPPGYLTTAYDPHGRPTVLDLIDVKIRLFSVGRLDYNSEGLLLLTNDGILAYRVAHPSFEVTKTYEVWVAGRPNNTEISSLKIGIELDDGWAQARRVSEIGDWARGTCWEIDLVEGRKRQVRRMFHAIGAPVKRLIRQRIGPLVLGQLPRGKTRLLTQTEIAALYDATKEVQL